MTRDPLASLAGLPRLAVPESLSSMVHDALSEAITSGALPLGFRLREIPLSQHFGVSTTPVREAVRRLEREGLVEVSPRRGAIVAGVDVERAADLYELREILECRAARRAAQQRGSDLSRLNQLLAEAEGFLDEPDQVEFNRLDVQFHRAIGDLGGNAQLAEMAERVHRRIQAVRIACAVSLPGRPRLSQRQHRAIVAAFKARDADRSETLVRAHIDDVREAVLKVLRDQGKADVA